MTKKIAVSLPDELVADARHAVATGQSASVSAYVAQALRLMRQESLDDIVRDWIEESGPPTEEDIAIARRILYGEQGKPEIATKGTSRRQVRGG